MTKRRLLLLLGSALVVAVLFLLFQWRQRQSAIDAALTWAELAPLPGSAAVIDVSTRGNMFSRRIVVSFVLERADLEAWLRASPGLVKAKRRLSGNLVRYEVTGRGQPTHAEISVDLDTGEVHVVAGWS